MSRSRQEDKGGSDSGDINKSCFRRLQTGREEEGAQGGWLASCKGQGQQSWQVLKVQQWEQVNSVADF